MQLHNTAQVLFKYQHPIPFCTQPQVSREICLGVDGPTPTPEGCRSKRDHTPGRSKSNNCEKRINVSRKACRASGCLSKAAVAQHQASSNHAQRSGPLCNRPKRIPVHKKHAHRTSRSPERPSSTTHTEPPHSATEPPKNLGRAGPATAHTAGHTLA